MARVIVFLKDAVPYTQMVKDALGQIGLIIQDYQSTIHTLVGELREARLEDLKNHSYVEWVETSVGQGSVNHTAQGE